eukprot:TRINITY_DN48839_c0_g1_i1.p1 TRINITY_DN48839_c0_g1~~TRINITY_DN48839_c0_g1_i1.p1  ORF type:complete len:380 (-),score=25.13 TRINITY_DN48839_c0_g1_i1:1241-2380(-)
MEKRFPLLLLLAVVSWVHGHGQLTHPLSNRANCSYETAGTCDGPYGCLWFSQITTIPGPPTVNDAKYRSYNVHVSSGPDDWSYKYPWRAPGSAPVRGSGCGVAGGSDVVLFNGGVSPPGVPQGTDGITLPAKEPTIWTAGSTVEVGFALTANHGGGYSYRLCPKSGPVNEECFQRTVLKFATDKQWIHFSPRYYPGAPRVQINRTSVTVGTHPKGSEWTRNPIPACNFCDQAPCGNPLFPPNLTDPSGTFPWGDKRVTYYGGEAWIKWVRCGVICAGEDAHQTFVNQSQPPSGPFCYGKTQFPEPYPFVSGFLFNSTYPAKAITALNIVDHVVVPDDLPSGEYLLSWRWDCEQSPQIWQNCADISVVVNNTAMPQRQGS